MLRRTSDGGVDTFVMQDAGLFVFFRGHPEYESETLMGEYRRDVGGYLKGERETYPLLALDYFEQETERSLREIEAEGLASRQEKLLGEVSAVLNSVRIQNTWRSTALLIYRNWLKHLCTQKRHGGKLMCCVGVKNMPLVGLEPSSRSPEEPAFSAGRGTDSGTVTDAERAGAAVGIRDNMAPLDILSVQFLVHWFTTEAVPGSTLGLDSLSISPNPRGESVLFGALASAPASC